MAARSGGGVAGGDGFEVAGLGQRGSLTTNDRRPKGTIAPPDGAYLKALRREKEVQYQDEDKQIDRMRMVRELRQPSGVGQEYRLVEIEVRDPTVADEIQRVSAALSVNDPACHVTPSRLGDLAESNATLREEWTQEVMKAAARRIPGLDSFTASVDNCVGDGGAWSKFLFLKDLWDERYRIRRKGLTDEPQTDDTGDQVDTADEYNKRTEDAKKAAGPPFVWIAVDPRTVYPIWSGIRLSEVLEVQKRPLHSTLRNYRLTMNGRGEIVPDVVGQPHSTGQADSSKQPAYVEFLEHWDETWVTYALMYGSGGVSKSAGPGDAQVYVVKQFKHGYGRVPYFPGFGLLMGYWRDRKVGWGVAETKRWLVEYRAFLMTIHANVAARDAFIPVIKQRPDGSPAIIGNDKRPKDREQWKLREIIETEPGEEYKPFPVPQTPDSWKEEMAAVNKLIEDLTTPRVTAQIGGGLEGAGFAINQVLAEAKITQNPFMQHLAQMLNEMTRFCWHLVRTKVKETVWVQKTTGEASGWLGAGPADLTDSVGVDWEIDPERPTAKLIEERYWHERMEKGTASTYQAIKAMGDNPDEVEYQRLLEAKKQEPWYQNYLTQQLTQRVGRGDIFLKAVAAEVAQTGQLPGATPPTGLLQPQSFMNKGAATPTQALGMGGNQQPQVAPDMGRLAAAPNAQGPRNATTTSTPPPAGNNGGGPSVPSQSGAAALTSLGG